jgi:hypothetical protein
VEQYQHAFGTGYGSRPRSFCLDSMNSYRDKRLNMRVHPSPFIHEKDIGKHQYFSCDKQKSCLLQIKLEGILHSLTNDATFVAERANPLLVRMTDRLATKLIATSGVSLFSFFNGLHVDTGDKISKGLANTVFPHPRKSWQDKMLSFADVSFPTTCAYQHVWKDSCMKDNYKVTQHFVMPGLGLGMLLDDSICHHFMGGSFSHCTALCVLKSLVDETILCNNNANIFRLFAWGNSVNSKTANGNISRINGLDNHRERQQHNRDTTRQPDNGSVSDLRGNQQHAGNSMTMTGKTLPFVSETLNNVKVCTAMVMIFESQILNNVKVCKPMVMIFVNY